MGNLGVDITKKALLDNIKRIQFLSNKGSVFGVQKGKNHILIRASESKFHTHECKGKIGHGWTDINRNNLLDFKNNSIDFFVFVTQWPTFEKSKPDCYQNKFVIIPTKDLEKLIKNKPTGQNGVYRFYFYFEGQKAIEIRDETTDYSDYFNHWDLIKNDLER